MRKISYILISGRITFSIIGRDETSDTSNASEGILSSSENGLIILQPYSIGEKYNAGLWVQHGGLELGNSTVTFTIDKSLLDSLNTVDGTGYQILPGDCYQMASTTVNVSVGDRPVGGTIVYDPTKIHTLCDYDNVRYIFPFKASTTGEKLNPDRSTLPLGSRISEPTIIIINSDIQEISIGNVKELSIIIGIPFSNKWNINCTLVNNQPVVDTYNSANQTYFSLLPAECHIKPESPSLSQGVDQITVSYRLKDNILPGSYIFPVQIGEVTPDVTIYTDKDTYTGPYIIKEGTKILKSDWEVLPFTTQEASGEGAGNGLAKCLIDGDTETFWRVKRQGGSSSLPYDIVIDMKQNTQIAQVGLLPRGRGSNNLIEVVRFAANENNVNWTPIGRLGFTNQNTVLEYYVKSIKACYIRFTTPDDGGNSTVAAIGELDVKGTVTN